MADAHKNFAYSTVATAPSPAASGTSLVVASGDGTKFPATPFNATVWPVNAQPTSGNAEIVRVTAIATDTFTITRNQESSNTRVILVGDQIAATITAKTLTDAEAPMTSFTPYVVHSGAQTGFQTLLSTSSQNSSASLYIFPVTVPGHLQFNQILIPVSLNYVTSGVNSSISLSHYSLFGLYSMNAGTALSLIASNSFSIGETINSISFTLSYASTTMTSGYGYTSAFIPASSVMSAFILGTRAFGLQFGSNMYLTPDIYYLGILYLRSTGLTNTYGMSHAGIFGHIINPLNIPGTVSGPLPIGSSGAQATAGTHSSMWWGRHMVGFITSGQIATIPASIALGSITNVAGTTASILPTVTFYST